MFLRDEHLVVDVIDHLVRRRVVRVLDLGGALVSLGVLVVMAWQMVPLARTMHEFGDVTSDLSIPKIYYWVPVLFGVSPRRWRRWSSSCAGGARLSNLAIGLLGA